MSRSSMTRRRALLLLALVTLGASACDDDGGSDGPSGGGGGQGSVYPRQVVVEYRVSSKTDLKTADVLYTNESGGLSNEDGVALPFSKKLARSVNQGDSLSLSVSARSGGELTAEIRTDDEVVETKSFSGTSVISGTAIHLFQ